MRRYLWALVAVALALAGACSGESTSSTEPPADDVVLRVVVEGEVAADWTLAALEEAVPFAEMTIDGDIQNGPLLSAVLDASGVSEWDSGEVVGFGEGRVFEVGLDISSSSIDDGWILDVTNKGSLKLASVELPREQWVRDVGEINFP
jgi:hypothetical protein